MSLSCWSFAPRLLYPHAELGLHEQEHNESNSPSMSGVRVRCSESSTACLVACFSPGEDCAVGGVSMSISPSVAVEMSWLALTAMSRLLAGSLVEVEESPIFVAATPSPGSSGGARAGWGVGRPCVNVILRVTKVKVEIMIAEGGRISVYFVRRLPRARALQFDA